MALTSASRPSSLHHLDIKFLVKSHDAYIFTFHELQKCLIPLYFICISQVFKVKCSTVSSWLKEILNTACIDVVTLKGHSTQLSSFSKAGL